MDHQCSNNKEADGLPISAAPTTTTRWWSKETVGIVTGGNKGIGYEIVKKLAEMGITVILTARDFKRGSQALHSLLTSSHSSLSLHFFCLDVSDPSSIKAFVSWFSHNFSALDILINNAGVSFNEIGENSVEKAEIVMKTNYFGVKLVTESLLPMFRRGGRILNITSRLGSFEKVKNVEVREILERSETVKEIEEGVVERFMEEVKSGKWREGGWPEQWTEYAVSKSAVNAYTRVLSLSSDSLSVNCYCPGFTKTSMTRGSGSHSPRHAATVAATIALHPNLPNGHFFLCSSSTPTPLLHSKL